MMSTSRLAYVALFIITLSVMLACSHSTTTPQSRSTPKLEEAYHTVLNLDPPSSIHHLQGAFQEMFPVFLSKGSFTYQADPSYFEMLAKHRAFIEPSTLNTPIHNVSCTQSAFPSDFSYWTNEPVLRQGYNCFTGIFFPYQHYLIYNPQTQTVQHFVEGIRD